ncbi:MAG: hypothetical protein HQK88_11440 [Nitrospirae bacterium]|nr:hypothetical protein [Nitrospirota bacterium]MBF0535558.1 hypothetical protein [Nitrospirota bacterium]MBF0617415.1 hypothetical protein [Nitrospirota bacterium]
MENISIHKISKPVLYNVFYRERIDDKLTEGLKRKVLWVSGPAGSGKTTLVSSFIDSKNITCIWYRIDSYDDDIASFFYTMGIAAKKAGRNKKKQLPLLTPEYLGGVSRFTENYFNELYQKVSTPFIIVLDDYHALSHDSKLHNIVYTGLSVLPKENVWVIIISRETPLPIFSPMIIRNEVYNLGWEDIKFTYQETADLLTHMHGTMSQDEINSRYNVSDGWVSALIVRNEKFNSGDYSSWLSSNRETIFNYFTSEIFGFLEKNTQEFLLKTAYIREMTVQVAQSLSGYTGAGKVLDYMVKKNYFIEKHGLKETTYSYHPLFRLFLLEKADAFFSQQEQCAIRRKAIEILMKHNFTDDASGLCIENSDWETLSSIILLNAAQFLTQGRTETLLRWLNALPDNLIENQPWFLYFKGCCFFPTNTTLALSLFENAFNGFIAIKDMDGILLSWSGYVDVVFVERGIFFRLDKWIDWIDANVDRNFNFPSLNVEISVVSSMIGILIFRKPEMASAEVWLNRALELMDNDIDLNVRIGLAAKLHLFFMYRGTFLTCRAIVKKMTPFLKNHSVEPMTQLMWSMVECVQFHIIDTNIKKFLDVVQNGLTISAENGVFVFEPVLCTLGAYGALSDGKFDKAEEFINYAFSKLPPNSYFDQANLHCVLVYRDLLLENYSGAVNNGNLQMFFAKMTEGPFLSMYTHLGLSQACFEMKMYDDALNHMTLSRQSVEGVIGFEIDFIFLYPEAYYYLTLGDRERGLVLLQKALKKSSQLNITNMVFWRPKVMRQLFVEALKADIETEYVRKVIRERSILPEEPYYELKEWPFLFRFYTFGKFHIVKDDNPIVSKGKSQKNAMALLKALIASNTSGVNESYISDILWPDSDGDEAYMSFKFTLHKLRQFLGNNEIIIFSGGNVSLDFRYCQTDVFLLDEIHTKTMKERLSDNNELSDDNISLLRNLTDTAIELYNGEFLPGDENYPWIKPTRVKLRNQFMDILSAAVSCALKKEQWYEAQQYCMLAVKVDELAEHFYRSLIFCHTKMGNTVEAHRVYNRFSEVLFSKLGIKPGVNMDAYIKKTFLK